MSKDKLLPLDCSCGKHPGYGSNVDGPGFQIICYTGCGKSGPKRPTWNGAVAGWNEGLPTDPKPEQGEDVVVYRDCRCDSCPNHLKGCPTLRPDREACQLEGCPFEDWFGHKKEIADLRKELEETEDKRHTLKCDLANAEETVRADRRQIADLDSDREKAEKDLGICETKYDLVVADNVKAKKRIEELKDHLAEIGGPIGKACAVLGLLECDAKTTMEELIVKVEGFKTKLAKAEKVVEYIGNEERDDSFPFRIAEIIDAVKDGWYYICQECNAPTSCSSDSCWNCSAENTGDTPNPEGEEKQDTQNQEPEQTGKKGEK